MDQENLQKYRRLVMLAGTASVSTAVLFIVIKFVVWMFSGSSVIFASLTDSIFDMLASLINLLALRFSLVFLWRLLTRSTVSVTISPSLLSL